MGEQKTPTLRDPKSLFGPLCIFVILTTVLSVSVGVASAAFNYLSQGDPDWMPTNQVEQIVTLATAGLSVLSIGAFLGAIIFTLTITVRMVKNLKIIGSGHMSMSPFWAAAFYFVPLANLIMPVNAITEVWRGTYAEIEEPPPREPNGAIAWWWGPWLLSNIIDNLAGRLLGQGLFQEPTQPTPEMLNAGTVLSLVAVLSLVIACFGMLSVFGKLARAQSQMIEKAQHQPALAS